MFSSSLNTSSARSSSFGLIETKRALRSRGKILKTATNLFVNNGFYTTSIDNIAAHSQSSKQTIYKYFANKENLAMEVVEQLIASLRKYADIDVDNTIGFETSMRNFAIDYVSCITNPKVIGTLKLCLSISDIFPGYLSLYYNHCYKSIRTNLQSYFACLIKDGVIVDASPSYLASSFLGMIRGDFLVRRIAMGESLPDSKALSEHVSLIVNIFCNGVKA